MYERVLKLKSFQQTQALAAYSSINLLEAIYNEKN